LFACSRAFFTSTALGSQTISNEGIDAGSARKGKWESGRRF
jgi:hypothetical protein